MTLPALPASIGPLIAPLSGLVRAVPAGTGTFEIQGRRACVRGVQRNTRFDIHIDGRTSVRGLSGVLGAAVNVVLHPGLIRRELAGPDGTCLETIVAAPSLPFVAIQWSSAGTGAPTEVAFEIPGDLAHLRANEEEGIVRATPDGSSTLVVGLVGERGSRKVQIEAREPGWVSVRWTELNGNPLTLVAAAGSSSEVASALAASGHLQGHANRAARSPVPDGLALSTGVEEIDDGVAWAVARIHAAAFTGGETDPARRLSTGLAAIAANDVEGTERLLQAGESHGDSVHGLLTATSALATGRSGAAARIARVWMDAGASAPHDVLGLADVACGRLADALRHGAPDALIAELRGAIGRGRAAGSSPGGQLPMAGRPAAGETTWGPWVSKLLAGDPGGAVPASDGGDIMIARRSCADFVRDPDAAWVTWRQLLASGISGDRLAQWAPGVPPEIVLALVHGLLGYSPDAPVGRVRLAPRLPSHLTAFTVRGLRVGDTSLTLHYEHADRLHRFTLEPVHAAVPPLAVFEPAIRGPIRAVRVDGEPAELDTRPSGARTAVPIQIPVDGRRIIEIEVEKSGDQPSSTTM